MMSTLPSPPLPLTDTSYTSSPILMTSPTVHHRSKLRQGHQRHPPRRHDTFELLQALVKEHQKLEQQEYDNEVREIPTLLGRNNPTTKGILIHPTVDSTHDACATTLSKRRSFATFSSSPSDSLSSSSSSSLSSPPSPALVRFAVGPPKVYRYPKLPTHQES